MSRTLHVFQVDAFTRRQFTGNPAGVVLAADAVADDEMLAIARELNNADTAFVLAPNAADHDVQLRFFTPRSEASFVGHATVAAHYVLSRRSGSATTVRQKHRSGIVEVSIRGTGDERRVAVRQAAPQLGRELNERERLAVLDALALSTGDIDERCPLLIGGAPSARLLIGVHGEEQLKQLKPDMNRLATLSAQLGAAGHFVFTLAPRTDDCLTSSRMFCPSLGIPEDPVSGNAHGILGAYLARIGVLKPQNARAAFVGMQGQSLQRPGRVEVELEWRDEALATVWIVGQAALVFDTTITI
ncbi:MAG: PhzF family phenazine biosynthesis isomerase [Steroidobacteraceae bacterium]